MASQIGLTTTEKLRFLQKKYEISPTEIYNIALVHVLKTKYKIDPDKVTLTELKNSITN